MQTHPILSAMRRPPDSEHERGAVASSDAKDPR